ncbi:MAG: Shedu anti-phage system protein SduA domain-containing protein [Polyangiaceae bacterium]
MRDDVRRLDAGNIVDLLLTDLAGFRDVVELKRPDAPVLRADPSHGSYYFSSAASRAIGQVHKYLDVLQDTMSHSLEAHPLLVAYHPRATIVIGRSHRWSKAQTRALRGLNARMHNITVMTYDHLVAQAKQLLRLVGDDDAPTLAVARP